MDTRIEIPARRGKAALVAAGQTVTVINTHGEQVVDTWAFNRADLAEFMSNEHTRAHSLHLVPKVGDVLRIDLAAEPSAGRQWALRGHAPPQLMELGAAQRVFGGRMSDQGTSSFAWRAVSAGEGDLTLVYGTATARAATPEKTVTIQLTVAGEALGPEEAHPPAVSQMEQVAAYERTGPCGVTSRV